MNTKAGLGVSPIISVSYSVSTIWGHNFGNTTLLLYSVFVLAEMILHSLLAYRRKKAGVPSVQKLSTVLLMDAMQFPLSLIFTRFLNVFGAQIPDLASDCAGTFWGTLPGQVLFLLIAIVMVFLQDVLGSVLAAVFHWDMRLGLCTASIPMVGGHGTAGAFGPVLEDFGIKGATTLCTAAATYGLIAGSMMGGPLGKMLIERHHLLDTIVPEDDSLLVEEEIKHERHSSMYPAASFQLIIAMGIGTVLSKLLSLTGMTFPIYIGAMIAAACIRNLGEYGGKFTVYMGEINDIGGICLSLFLGMAMITLKIWQLAELALPLVVLLAGQTLFMILYVVLVVFNIMGHDYDAAVIVSGTCGFGMGATPNAMANMQAVCDKYSPSVKAYLLIPLVGSLFADFINSLVITVFINFI